MGLVLQVIGEHDGHLLATMPGVPAGYEVLLKPEGPDQYRNIGGPVDGSTLTFLCNEANEVTSIQVGTYELLKIKPDKLETLPVVERFPAPEFKLSAEKRAQFDELLETSLKQADGSWIDYKLSYPKHEFIQFITQQDQIIFHGSNNQQIDEFQPIRKSMELRDETGRGNIQGVYGTHDGLWAMFFAIIDKAKQRGSIRNGVMYFQNRAGEQISVYNFSINQEQLEERPYTEGALYFLPRKTFTRLQLTPESYANEWASEQPVKPIAKLRLQPKDFPFLEQISGHDDSELMRLNTISEQIQASAVAAILEDNRFEIVLPRDAEVIIDLEEYIDMQRMLMPTAKFELEEHAQGTKLIMASLPPAVKQMLSDQYQDLLK
jgi:hypothetical protein